MMKSQQMREKCRRALLHIRKAGKSRAILEAYAQKQHISLAEAMKHFRAIAQFICATMELWYKGRVPSDTLARAIRVAAALPGFDDWRSKLDPHPIELASGFSLQVKEHHYLIAFEFATQIFGKRALKRQFWPRLPPVKKIILSPEDMRLGSRADSEAM